MRRVLLGSSALTCLLVPWLAGAAEVTPGGKLDIEIAGYVRFLAYGGDVDDAQLDPTLSTGLDFFTDTEVDLRISGTSDRTGLKYGAVVELEADTDATANTDETWLFVQGEKVGEIRLGDEDGISDVDGEAVSAPSLAAGTGGLDGDIVSAFGGNVPSFEPIGTSDATKIVYRSPAFAGFALSGSYTPNLAEIGSGEENGDSLASRDIVAGDVFEGAFKYENILDRVSVEAALSGLYGDIKNKGEAGGSNYWAAQAGAVLSLLAHAPHDPDDEDELAAIPYLSFAASYLTEEVGAIEAQAITIGLGAGYGPLAGSLNYGQIISSDNIDVGEDTLDKPWTVIASASLTLMPGLSLDGDVGYFDNDIDGNPVNAGDDTGWLAVTRVALTF